MDVTGSAGSLAVTIGTNHGVLAIGDNNVVHLHVPAPPRPTLRTPAPVHRRRTPDGFLDRRLETGTLLAAFGTHPIVEVSGAPRIGKSWFLKQAADKAGAQFPDGALHLPPGLQGPRDVLQSLFVMFYDTAQPMAPTSTELREYLADRRALVVVDDSTLSAKDTEAVLDAASGCRLLLAGNGAVAYESVSIPLAGLPIDDAMALAERVYGSALTGAAYTALLERCRAVDGHPQRVIDAVRLLLAEAAAEITPPQPEGSERALLDAVRAFAPHAVPSDCLPELARVPDAEPALAALLARGLIQTDGDDVRLAAPIAPTADEARQRVDALVRLGQAARAEPARRRSALKALPLLWLTLGKAVSAHSHADVLALTQAWHVPVTLSGLWDGWRELLMRGLDAARALGDAGAQAWLLHQAGTRELALGQTAAATALFKQALQIEQQLGDATLQAATQHHLDLIDALPLADGQNGGGSVDPLPVAWGVKVGIVAAVLGLAGTAWIATAPELEWTPKQLDFGAVTLAAGAAAQPVVFHNRGWRAVPLGSQGLSGSGAASYAAEGACAGRELHHGESCSVAVRFVPLARGSAEATLSLRTADGAAVVPLRGRVQQAELVLPAQLDFGAADVGGPAIERSVELRNAGDGPARITGFAPPGAPFTLVADACRGRTLAPQQACAATLRFSAAAAGPVEQRLALRAADEPGLVVPSLPLSGTGRSAALGAEPVTLDFGAQELGVPSPPQPVQVTNHGSAPVKLAAPVVSPSYAPFRVVPGGCRGATLAPGEGCEFEVTFVPRPGQRGERTGTVRLAAPSGKPLVVALAGVGAAADAVLEPTVLDFGNRDWPPAKTGAPARARSVTLSNRGEVMLRLAALRIGGATVADFPFRENCPAELAPGARCEIVVRYLPHAAGASDAYLTIDAPGAEGDLRLPLLGRAVITAPAVASLRLPGDGASVVCSSSETSIDFEWSAPAGMPAGPVSYRLVRMPGGVLDAGPATRLRTTVPCPTVLRWRVETSSPNQASGASVWRTLRTYRSGSGAGPPGTRASG